MEVRKDREGGEMRCIGAGEGAPLGRRRRRTNRARGYLHALHERERAAAVAVAGGRWGERGAGAGGGVECVG